MIKIPNFNENGTRFYFSAFFTLLYHRTPRQVITIGLQRAHFRLIKKLNYNMQFAVEKKLPEYKIEPKVHLHPIQGGRETATNLQ